VAEGLGLATQVIGGGEAASAVVRMPERPGAHEYLCSLHPVLMRGLIRVE
jgi:plastocyanin